MSFFLIDIPQAVNRFQNLAGDILQAHENSADVVSGKDSPEQIIEGIDQFLRIAGQLDMSKDTSDAVDSRDVTQLGDHVLSLLVDLHQWIHQHALHDLSEEAHLITLSTADWIIRHHGQIQILEPIVDALANTANNCDQPKKLGSLADFMGVVQKSCSSIINDDLEKNNPDRPWRILCFNRCITATRSNNTDRMERAFSTLLQILPEEAPTFFSEGMREMDKLNYPSHIRAVMQKYFDKYTRPTMN